MGLFWVHFRSAITFMSGRPLLAGGRMFMTLECIWFFKVYSFQVYGSEQSAALSHRPRGVNAHDACVQVHRPGSPLLLRTQHPQVLGGRGEWRGKDTKRAKYIRGRNKIWSARLPERSTCERIPSYWFCSVLQCVRLRLSKSCWQRLKTDLTRSGSGVFPRGFWRLLRSPTRHCTPARP